MRTFGRTDALEGAQFDGANLRGAQFTGSTLRGARFARSDLSGVVMRGVDAQGLEIDAPWLLDGESTLVVNGVDVAPLVEAELNRRFPGRAQQRAEDPQGLRDAWTVLQATWAQTLAGAAALPEGSLEVSVAGEWSFAQTLRHLVLATDVWLRRAILGVQQPFHPLGQAGPEAAEDGMDLSVFATGTPPYAEVLAARASRVAMVGEFLASVTPGILSEKRSNPWSPDYPETVLSCLHVILEEEWEHHRYAVRDLAVIQARDVDPVTKDG